MGSVVDWTKKNVLEEAGVRMEDVCKQELVVSQGLVGKEALLEGIIREDGQDGPWAALMTVSPSNGVSRWMSSRVDRRFLPFLNGLL